MQITIFGCGTMGRAIAMGIAGAGHRSDMHLVLMDRTPALADALAEHAGGRVASAVDDALDGADVLLVCVKPADTPELFSHIARARAGLTVEDGSRRRQLLVSIAAGVSTAAIEETFHSDSALAVVRAMPNTACAIGRGMTVLARGTAATADDLALAHALFERTGRVLELEERHFDAVTALSASGPAFLYLIIESLVDGGVRCGMPRRHALELATHMTLGAAALIIDSGKHPAVLRDEVTTPGGCTAVGLAALEDGGVRSTVARAVEVTEQRARVLGSATAR
jgi:pyrroline-5-carboxylate reductase